MPKILLGLSLLALLGALAHEWLATRLVEESISGTLLAGEGSFADALIVLTVLALRLAALALAPAWFMTFAATFARPIRSRMGYSRTE